jgi:glutamate-1-semialdehyde 2,1-aminomutase
VRPDLWCFGKVIGGGLPVGAFGGRRDVLSVLAPAGPVYQAGTLSGNPLATVAGLTVLTLMDPPAYADLSDRVAAFGASLAKVLTSALAGSGFTAQVPVVGPLVGVFFVADGEGPVTDYDGAARAAATGIYRRFFRSMLDRGVALAPGPYEVAFPSMAHGSEELAWTVDVAGAAIAEVLDSQP